MHISPRRRTARGAGRGPRPRAWRLALAAAAARAGACPLPSAASTWLVTVQASIGAGAPIHRTLEVELSGPSGSALIHFNGASLGISHTVGTFSVGTSVTAPYSGCARTVSAGAGAPFQISSDHAAAVSPISGRVVAECPGGVPPPATLPITGSFFARPLDIISIPPAVADSPCAFR